MKYGHFADNDIFPIVSCTEAKVNSKGYRCPEFAPLPHGKKNVVVLGCSHTFGVGHAENTHWVSHLSKHNTKILRYWNLGIPGVSTDRMVRLLYSTEKVLFPKVIICCWPSISRRERLDKVPMDLFGKDKHLRYETDDTDYENFLRNVFFVEKFAEYTHAKTFHCFAEEVQNMPKNLAVMDYDSLKTCWPPWDNHNLPNARRERITEPNLAQDGIHYGDKHHSGFAKLFLDKFRLKLK